MKIVCMHVQLCPTLYYSMYDSLPGSSVHGISQSRIQELVAISFSRWASLVAQLVKNPPAMWETWVRSLGWEDPQENGMATHSSSLAWRIAWTV